jgi:hypothetical protein
MPGPKISKRRRVTQPIWQNFLKFLSHEKPYIQILEGSEVLKLMRCTLLSLSHPCISRLSRDPLKCWIEFKTPAVSWN